MLDKSNMPCKIIDTVGNTSNLPKDQQQKLELSGESCLKNKTRKQYIAKIRLLENQVAELQGELQYKVQAHERELENVKIFMQYEMQEKVQKHKAKLRQQYHNLFLQLQKYQNENSYNNQQISLLTQKIKRLQSYCTELQLERQTKALQFRQQKQAIAFPLNEQIAQKTKQLQQTKKQMLMQLKMKQNAMKSEIEGLQGKLQKILVENQALFKKIEELRNKNDEMRVDLEQQILEKEKQINELIARLDIHRQKSIEEYLSETRFKRDQNMKFIESSAKIEIPKYSYTQNLRQQIKVEANRIQTAVSRQKIYSQKYNTVKKATNHTKVFGNIMKMNSNKNKDKVKEEYFPAKKIYTQEKQHHLHTIETNFDQSDIFKSDLQSPTFATISD